MFYTFMYAVIPVTELNPKKVFKKEYMYLNPVLGCLGWETALMHNLRFFGNYEKGIKEGKRDFSNDQSNDPVWQLIRILFPSTGGQLTTLALSTSNLGMEIKDPKVVAHLLKYVNLCRTPKTIKKIIIRGKEEIKESKDQPFEITKGKIKIKKALNLKNNEIFNVIENAVNEELLQYPKYTIEQALLSFLWVHFDKEFKENSGSIKNTLAEFFQELGDVFEADGNDLIVEYVLGKVNQQGLTPYKKGQINAVNNAAAQFYDRKNNALLQKEFPDCIETALRHICTLICFDHNKKNYIDMSNYGDNLNSFFSSLKDPNSGSLEIRSQWNKVVADLGEGSLPAVVYYKDKNELLPGLLNVANVLMRIFQINDDSIILKFNALYREIQGDGDGSESQLKELFKNIFEKINPNNNYEINLYSLQKKKNLDEKMNDIYGSLSVKFNPKDCDDTVSFEYLSQVNHGEITKIDDEFLIKKEKVLKLLPNSLENVFQNAMLLERSKKENLHFIYQLFLKIFNDDNSKIRFFKNFKKLWGEKKLPPVCLKYLENVLGDINYDEEYIAGLITNEITPIINDEKYFDLKAVFEKTVRTLNIKEFSGEDLDLDYVKNFKELEKFYMTGESKIKLRFGIEHKVLKKINIEGAILEEDFNLSKLPNLEEIRISKSVLKLILRNQNLKKIYIENSNIGETLDLMHCPNLEIVEIRENNATLKSIQIPDSVKEKLDSKSRAVVGNFS